MILFISMTFTDLEITLDILSYIEVWLVNNITVVRGKNQSKKYNVSSRLDLERFDHILKLVLSYVKSFQAELRTTALHST